MLRANYDVSVSTRIDEETKNKLEGIALSKKQKLSELLREAITAFVYGPPTVEEFLAAKAEFGQKVGVAGND